MVQESEGRDRTRNARGQGGQLREEILAAAARVVAESADESSVSLRAIARQAGIAAPSIYEHFANKADILRELLAHDYADLVARLRAAVTDSDPGPDGVGTALAAAQAFSVYAGDEPGRYRLMFEFRQEPMSPAELARHPVQGVVDVLADAVAETPASRSGRFTPHELALALLSALHGQISLWRTLPMSPGLGTYPANRERTVRALVGAH
jgi:AcrR family transcriptional regulator